MPLVKRMDRRTRVARVLAHSTGSTQGRLHLGAMMVRCALGRGGVSARKREGDGATPIGRFAILAVYYRADKVVRPRSALPVRAIRRDDGWCDAPGDRNYNAWVRHPYGASAERLWRDDDLYDLVVVLDYKIWPRWRGRGSAIFLHVARPGFAPTEGCVALRMPELLRIIAALGRQGAVQVRG